MSQNVFITTSIPYVNGEPHIGFALEAVETDALARYFRLIGKNVFFLTGTDENGIKIYKTAQTEGLTPQALCDRNSARFQALRPILNLSNNGFIRTTDRAKHWPGAQALWKKLADKGDIYKKTYEGYYCEGCEAFVTEKELIDGNCPNHKKPPVKIAEENYFFRLSRYTEKILNLIQSGQLKITPEFRQNEIIALLQEGLQDVSFSRTRQNLPWGVPVPGDENQVMYVWCDALVNYLSGLGFGASEDQNFQTFWQDPATQKIHVIGKDIVRFHLAIWPAMLLAAGLNLPQQVLVHGFITSDGQKMSKSLGNVVDPFALVQTYGTDAVRYYLLREIPVGRDGDFTYPHFEELYNAHLANGLGNLVNRVVILAQKNQINPQSFEDVIGAQAELQKGWKEYQQKMQSLMLNEAVYAIWDLIDFANKKIDEEKPWLLAKTDIAHLQNVLGALLEVIRQISLMLSPILPETAQKIRQILGLSDLKILQGKENWQGEKIEKLNASAVLFPRKEKSPSPLSRGVQVK